MGSIALQYMSSEAIVQYVAEHPIDWDDRDLAKRGGVGDTAGVPPTPSVEEFIKLFYTKRGLFTQEEYWEGCWNSWDVYDAEWCVCLTEEQIRGLRAKAFRNFYPSMIDSLHSWSLLVESGKFDVCNMDSLQDAVGKTDLTIIDKMGRIHQVALVGPTPSAKDCAVYKHNNRNNGADLVGVHSVQLPYERPRSPGNKRWFQIDDFALLIQNAKAVTAPEQSRVCGVAGGHRVDMVDSDNPFNEDDADEYPDLEIPF